MKVTSPTVEGIEAGRSLRGDATSDGDASVLKVSASVPGSWLSRGAPRSGQHRHEHLPEHAGAG